MDVQFHIFITSTPDEGKWQVLRPGHFIPLEEPAPINPLNTELNPICHLLALLGAHHIFHVSGLRVK